MRNYVIIILNYIYDEDFFQIIYLLIFTNIEIIFMGFFDIMLFNFPLWKLILLTVGGVIAGFLNTIAGGGSLLTIPLLIFLGLPTITANGTNRMAILLQNIAGVTRFSTKKVLSWDKDSVKRIVKLLIPSVIGGGVGALIAIFIPKDAFDIIVGILMLMIVITLFLKPKEWEKQTNNITEKWWRYPLFFVIGVYGGFIQAGVGFLLLSALVVGMGFNVLSANALKVLVVLCYTVLAIIIYIVDGQVIWIAGLFLSIGNVIGSFIGVSSILKVKPVFIRWLLIVVVLITALKLFGVLDLLF
jgi:uncharacterized protein